MSDTEAVNTSQEVKETPTKKPRASKKKSAEEYLKIEGSFNESLEKVGEVEGRRRTRAAARGDPVPPPPPKKSKRTKGTPEKATSPKKEKSETSTESIEEEKKEEVPTSSVEDTPNNDIDTSMETSDTKEEEPTKNENNVASTEKVAEPEESEKPALAVSPIKKSVEEVIDQPEKPEVPNDQPNGEMEKGEVEPQTNTETKTAAVE